MRMDKLSVTAAEALQAAMGFSADAQAAAVDNIHLLKALLESGERNINALIERVGADPRALANQVNATIERAPKVAGDMSQMGMTNDMMRTMNAAEKLAADLSARADTIQNIRDHIEKRAPEIEKEYAAKFKARVEEILGGVYEVPEERIALEAAIFADKANITEELVRLGSHISQLRSFLKSDGKEAIGKKIDFLIQEMNREANTIGSKSNDREITSNMLELKAEIEKVREQVQNIE